MVPFPSNVWQSKKVLVSGDGQYIGCDYRYEDFVEFVPAIVKDLTEPKEETA